MNEAAMHRYSIYGASLASELDFPELRTIDAPPEGEPARWKFSVDRTLPADPSGPLIGEEHIYGDVYARLRRAPDDGYWIHVPDTGTYHISTDGSTIRWRPNEDPWWDFGRAHLMGRVLATSLHLDGVLTLHGSAVEIDGGAVAFLAAKGTGKSTLALALAASGCPLLTDDALPVRPQPSGPPTALPGVHTVRLTAESREALGLHQAATTATREGKFPLWDLPTGMIACSPLPLRAIYLLAPVAPGVHVVAAERVRLGAVEATLALRSQEKIGAMLGVEHAPELLSRGSAIARAVPVHGLGVVRDMGRLDEVVAQVWAWHGGGAGSDVD